MPSDSDNTLYSLLFYRILADKKAYCYAQTWWAGNYAGILFPYARLHSQRISEFLAALGSEEVQRHFFEDYLASIYCPGNIVDVSTLCTTMADLSQYDVSIDYTVVDAGYFSEGNVKELYQNKVH